MKLSKKPLDLSRHLPAGMGMKEQKFIFGFFTVAAIIWPIMSFGSRLSDALRDLERGYEEMMPYFYEVLGNALLVIPLAFAAMFAMAAMHYIYHWQGSRSIYLMRRLPSRWELHRRCLTLPALGIAFFLILGAAMMFIMYGVYLLAAPDGTVAPDQLEKLIELWRVI